MQRESSIGCCDASKSGTNVEITYKRKQKRTRLESSKCTPASCKMPRQAGVSSELDLDGTQIVETGRPQVVLTETDAVALTRRGHKDFPPNRRLTEFSFYDEDETLQLVEVIETKKMYISGAILPLEGASGKGKEKGVQCNGFGPILEWSISGFDEGSPILWISTGIAHYECLEPSSAYKILYNLFFEKARACIETYRRLSRSYGGNPELSLNDLVAAVASRMSKASLSHTASIQDLIVSWGRFIYEQLIGLEKSESTEDPIFSELPVLLALRDASMKTSFVKSGDKTKCLQSSEYTAASGKATKISDSSTVTSAETAKQAAIFAGLKHKSVLLSKPQVVEKESDAIRLTKVGLSDSPPNRRLTYFTFYDEDGIIQLVDMLEVKNMYVSGLILPLEESCDEERGKGIKCEGFGPILEWSISGFDDGLPIVWISTDVAHYECLQPSIAYKHLYGIFFEKARACVETYRILSNTCGGNPNLSLNELLTAVFHSMSKSKSKNKNIPQGISIKSLIVSWGGFIYEQLKGLEKSNSDEDPMFGELPVLVALRDASAKISDMKTGNKKRQIRSYSNQYFIASTEIGKQAALFAGLKCKSGCLQYSSRRGESTRHRLVERESDAIRFTKIDQKDSPPNRQLTDFIFYDKDGTLQLVDMLELKDMYASGFILPLEEAVQTEKNSGVKCEGFGPILSWSISGFEEGSPIIWVSTDVAHYECIHPAATYRIIYNLFLEKAHACIMTYRLLSTSYGGNPDLSLNELLTAVVHLMSKSENIPKGTCIKNLIILWGRFIHDQLMGLEKSEPEEDPIFSELPALIALRNASMRARNKKETRLKSSENLTVSRKVEEPSAPFASLNYRSDCWSDNSRLIEYRKLQVVEEESDALMLTKTDPDDSPPNRRLIDFSFYDADSILQPVDILDVNAVYVTGIILPLEEASNIVEMKGAKCEGFGPILEWSISGFDEGSPVIWISTDVAHYECLMPAPAYKRLYSLLFEKARACVEAYRRLSKSYGGNDNLTLNELLAALVRSMSKSGGLPTGTSIKELITSWGWFIYEQLAGLENPDSKEEPIFGDLPVLIALRDASLRILDLKTREEKKNSHSNECAPEDDIKMKLDRLLQEKKNWLASFKPNKRLHPAKISEDEIADDYPIPAYYKAEVQERDEYTIFDEESYGLYPDQLPHSSLHNWSVYNSEGRMISLELLPLKSCPDIDMKVYGSGTMTADDGSGFYLQDDKSPTNSKDLSIDATPVFLSAIKEWKIEFRSAMIFVLIRTDMSWYRLGKPSEQYAPWLKPVLRTARLAIAIITLLKLQSRASSLSFLDVIKKVSQFDDSHPGHVSSDLAAVHRYILVHGQIILQLFSEYPDITISKCAFTSTLRNKMEEKHQSKWLSILKHETDRNQGALNLATISKRKAIPATTTKLINRIWQQYCSNHMHWESEEALQKFDHAQQTTRSDERWDAESVQRTSGGEALFTRALANGHMVRVGHTVMVRTSDSMKHSCICFIEYMFQSSDNRKLVHGRLLLKGFQTVLGDTASESELFLTNDCIEFELADVLQTLVVEISQIPWRYQDRKANADNDKLVEGRAWKRKIKGLPLEYFCRSLYWPERGAFFCLPTTVMGLGTGDCNSCKMKQALNARVFKLCTSTATFTYRGIQYSIGDFLYLSPLYLAENVKQKTTFKNSRNVGLKSYIVCQLLGVESDKSFELADPECVMIKVRRFFKPEDISTEKAFFSDVPEVYYSEKIVKAPVAAVEGKCDVKNKQDFQFTVCHNSLYVFEHVFFCQHLYDTENGTLKQLPSNVELGFSSKEHRVQNDSITNEEVKCIEGENKSECTEKAVDEAARSPLATLDIFAGCGGLSAGLKQSGVSVSKWAIECEEAAAAAFKLNHPEAVTITSNSNAILRAIMIACGDGDECISNSDEAKLAPKLDEKVINSLPRPGEVDFIVGGPPCQGFSGLNRFQESAWSRTQCEMILSFLSYVEYYRPKFVLLENVRNFVSFEKGKMFRLTLASLLEMGYQVRFGVLEAGAYGVAQTRKRVFIWAACPEATLPEWPEPMHVFSGPELKIQLDSGGKTHYTAVRSTATGAPFRSITVRDAISDLPAVRSGASATTMEYEGKPLSWFQKRVRGDMVHLTDHISKEMNQLNLIRCQKIPKCPGADWRDLPHQKVKLSNGKEADLVPRFLKNTAKTHNEWKGLFGRLDWEGNFPTTITDPTPGGKVGMCFHPDQDRIISVRECARSQGFPDSYKFAGSIQQKHRQIGNAVPPPLAFALGRKLREAIDQNL